MAFSCLCLPVLLLILFVLCLPAYSRPSSTLGFISIDCGIAEGSSYTYNGVINFTSDHKYLDSVNIPGKVYNIPLQNRNSNLPEYDKTLRSFPGNVTRNCYTLQPVVVGKKYLVRATFFHGEYDQGDMPVVFKLYIGTNLWKTVNISDASKEYRHELITVAPAEYIWVCLVNTDSGTPFISALELRPVDESLYPNATASTSNELFINMNYGPSDGRIIRFPDDPFDRIWSPYKYDSALWTENTTNATITYTNDEVWEVPIRVLQTCITPTDPKTSSNMSVLKWVAEAAGEGTTVQGYYISLHFVDFLAMSGNMSRWFSIIDSDSLWYGPFQPWYLQSEYIYAKSPSTNTDYDFQLSKWPNSTLPPFINAAHIVSPISHSIPMTDLTDVTAMVKIRTQYQVTKNWMGDPCKPDFYAWEGLQCKGTPSKDPRIVHIDLSRSNLTGVISQDFSALDQVAFLDLSYNNLTGLIPGWLAKMNSLQVLNLSGNSFAGGVPQVLLDKAKTGSMTLIVDSTCYNDISCRRPPNSSNGKGGVATPVVVVISVVAAVFGVIILLLLWVLFRRRRGRYNQASRSTSDGQQNIVRTEEPTVFTYSQLKSITGNFGTVIGRGGFGVVYHGRMQDDTEVAVKFSSNVSPVQIRQFLAEAKNLMQVHHKNLVSLVGYCRSDDVLALVYEYMPEGSFHDHIRGKNTDRLHVLNWRTRLQILYEAAKGLDYLHTGCNIVHRDVKSSNILLDKNFHARVSDFGLAKVTGNDVSMTATSVSGTPGYIDPEYQTNLKFTGKSDVYSFGVVLLETITAKPPIMVDRENIHIINYVKKNITKGNIEDIMDERLKEEGYDSASVWKVLDLALSCTAEASSQRPAMSEVVNVLRRCLASDMASRNHTANKNYTDISNTSNTSTSPGLYLSTSFDPKAR